MDEKNKNNSGQNPSLKDLIDIKEWQKIQDNFSEITHVAMRTLDSNGDQITKPSNEPRLCTEVLKDYALKIGLCGHCLPTFLGGRAVVDRNLGFVCPLGLQNYVVPLKVFEEKAIAFTVIGPINLITTKRKEDYAKIAEELRVDLNELWGAVLEIRVMSFHSAHSLTELVEDIGGVILRSSYQKLTHDREMIVVDSSKLSKVLNVLLEVAFQVSGADVGSIMILDAKKGELTISVSKGLPNEVVRNSRVKIGDGIAGTVAKERTSMLIDENLKDNRIRGYLDRPYIKSSMIVPIKAKNSVVGVVNLGVTQSSPLKFDRDDLKLMGSLVDLATLALHE